MTPNRPERSHEERNADTVGQERSHLERNADPVGQEPLSTGRRQTAEADELKWKLEGKMGWRDIHRRTFPLKSLSRTPYKHTPVYKAGYIIIRMSE